MSLSKLSPAHQAEQQQCTLDRKLAFPNSKIPLPSPSENHNEICESRNTCGCLQLKGDQSN